MKIAVWSPTPFAGRKSTHLLLMALQEIAEGDGEQLVLHTDVSGSGPEHFLLSGGHRRRMMVQREFGVELLTKLLRCERFSKELVTNTAYTFVEGKLHVLPAGNAMFYQEDEAAEEICTIMRYADKEFQNVWVELPAGESAFAHRIISEADGVIVNLTQSPFELSKIERMPDLKKVFYIVGAYEQRNIYSLHNLTLLFPELRGRSAVIPYDKGVLEAWCRGDAENFWIRGISRKETEPLSGFFHAVEKTYGKWREGWKPEVCGEEKSGA